MVFETIRGIRSFLETYGEELIKMKGKYKIQLRVWEFPWGSSIMLTSVIGIEIKTRGMIFSRIELDENIEPEIKDIVMSRRRIVL